MIRHIYIELKRTIRNKRFLLFTLLFPIVFLFVLSSVYKGLNLYGKFHELTVFICAIAGTLGSGLNTLSARVGGDKQYIMKYLSITPTKPIRYILVMSIVQLILNILIIAVVFIVSVIFFEFPFNSVVVYMKLLIILFGSIFYILLGIILGLLFDKQSLQTVSVPLFMVFFTFSGLQNVLTYMPPLIKDISRFFPATYVNKVISSLSMHTFDINSFILLIVYNLVCFLVAIFVYYFLKNRLNSER